MRIKMSDKVYSVYLRKSNLFGFILSTLFLSYFTTLFFPQNVEDYDIDYDTIIERYGYEKK